MRVTQRSNLLYAWGNKLKQDADVARYTQDPDVQMRIAKNSNHRMVLVNLALNENLSDEIIQKLFDRDIPEITSRLERLGYKTKSWF